MFISLLFEVTDAIIWIKFVNLIFTVCIHMPLLNAPLSQLICEMDKRKHVFTSHSLKTTSASLNYEGNCKGEELMG